MSGWIGDPEVSRARYLATQIILRWAGYASGCCKHAHTYRWCNERVIEDQLPYFGWMGVPEVSRGRDHAALRRTAMRVDAASCCKVWLPVIDCLIRPVRSFRTAHLGFLYTLSTSPISIDCFYHNVYRALLYMQGNLI